MVGFGWDVWVGVFLFCDLFFGYRKDMIIFILVMNCVDIGDIFEG